MPAWDPAAYICARSTQGRSSQILVCMRCAGVMVAAFQHMPQHRGAIMEELLGGVLPHAVTARAVSRATALVPDAQPAIHIVTSLVLQMLQVALHKSWCQSLCMLQTCLHSKDPDVR